MQDLTMTTNEDGWLAVQLHGSAPGEFPNLLLHNDDILLALSGAEAEVPRFDLPATEKNLPASLPASPTPPPTPSPTPPSTPRPPTPAEAARYKQRRSAAAQHRNKRHAARQRKQRASIFKDRLENKHALLLQRLVPIRKRNCKKKEKEDEEGKENKGNEDEDDFLEDEDDLLEFLILTVLLPLLATFLFALMYVAPSSTPWVCWQNAGVWSFLFLYCYLVYLKYIEENGTSNKIDELAL